MQHNPVAHPTPAQVAAAMHANDAVAHDLNMQLVSVGDGCAELTMTIEPRMTNGVHTAHGGYIFTLADTAFAYACNSSNQFAVAADCSIQFLRPAHAGSVLRAVASEVVWVGRTGIYDVLVTDAASGEVVATFRGKSARIVGTHLPQ